MKKLIVFMFSIVLFGSCQKDIEGCTDVNAVNYNPDANIDNSTCQYVPTLSTAPVVYDSILSAESGGVITSDGGSAITLRGICWGASPNPTTTNDTSVNGSGTGVFNSFITNLNISSTYYVRAYATNSNGTGYGNELTFTRPLSIGDTFEGGIVFYLDGNGGGLIAAPTDQSTAAEWGCFLTLIGADGTAIGTGNQNTIDIEAGCTTPGTAADICANLTLGGYSDWFLPSKDELNEMFINLYLQGIGGFGPNVYWSSTEYADDVAWVQYFGIGGLFNFKVKNDVSYFRSVRAF